MSDAARVSAESPADEFLRDVAAREHEPLLQRASGTVRFDVVGDERTEHRFVTMRAGEVAVSRRNARADAVVRLDRATFDGMATGTVNAMAATLRGDLEADGDLGLALLFQRLFPSP